LAHQTRLTSKCSKARDCQQLQTIEVATTTSGYHSYGFAIFEYLNGRLIS